jgi:EAL domain-containing protein (putative c-di-GMP-specific phosphodiesterase class I)
MKTTAKGVETEQELQTLKEEGCTAVQGFCSASQCLRRRLHNSQSRKAMKAVAWPFWRLGLTIPSFSMRSHHILYL